MTEKEVVFLQAAIDAANGKDGNFGFDCPFCGGYCIGVRKNAFDRIISHCSVCGVSVREKIIKKGA